MVPDSVVKARTEPVTDIAQTHIRSHSRSLLMRRDLILKKFQLSISIFEQLQIVLEVFCELLELALEFTVVLDVLALALLHLLELLMHKSAALCGNISKL